MNKCFRFFSNCFWVEGYKESIIVDVQRSTFFPISNLAYDVFNTLNDHSFSVEELKEANNNEMDEGIDKYIDFFISNEIGFFTDIPESFPPINLQWYSPRLLATGIAEFGIESNYNLKSVLEKFISFRCLNVQIRILSFEVFQRVIEALKCITDSSIKGVELLVNYSASLTVADIIEVLEMFPRVIRIIVYNSPENKRLKEHKFSRVNRIFFDTKDISEITKNKVTLNHFEANIRVFVESQKHNVGLNQCCSINKFGEVKNYLSHKSKFGNVSADCIEGIVSSTKFQKQWNISNDKIEKCKECQFRYICSNQSEVVMKKGKYYKVDNCGFNPHKNKWDHEE